MDCNENYNPTNGGTMPTEQKDRLTIKDTAGIAIIAYCGVKVLQASAATVVNTIHFRRARKANKDEK